MVSKSNKALLDKLVSAAKNKITSLRTRDTSKSPEVKHLITHTTRTVMRRAKHPKKFMMHPSILKHEEDLLKPIRVRTKVVTKFVVKKRKISEETRRKMSAAQKARRAKEAKSKKKRK